MTENPSEIVQKRRPGRPKGSVNRKPEEISFPFTAPQLLAVKLHGKGLPQSKIAEALNVHPSKIQRWIARLDKALAPLVDKLCEQSREILEANTIDAAIVYARAIHGSNARLALDAARDVLYSFSILVKSPLVIDTPLSLAQIDTELKRILAPLSGVKQDKIEGSICPPNMGQV